MKLIISLNIKKDTSGGIDFCGLLTIVFITLKLLNVITWSWLWVLAPIWIPIAIVLIITIITGIVQFIKFIIMKLMMKHL